MRKTIVSLLAVAAVLSVATAPASASSHHGFGLGALVAGAVVGAEIASHSAQRHEGGRQVTFPHAPNGCPYNLAKVCYQTDDGRLTDCRCAS